MIPKIIHYCWFGYGPKPKLIKKCISSWRKYCPNYKIIEWNEDNIDFSIMPEYVKEAYKEKKWGFVPDYIRLWLVYKYGGIYLDTDVEIIRNIDELLSLKGFAGFELNDTIALGLGFGAEKENQTIKELMDSYNNIHFVNNDGSLNITPAPQLNRKEFLKKGMIPNGKTQSCGDMILFSKEYFCPISYENGKKEITNNTFTIHHYMGSWLTNEQKKQHKKELLQKKYWYVDKIVHLPNIILRKTIGNDNYEKIKRYIKHL